MSTSSEMTGRNAVGWRLESTYARLPEIFFQPVRPAPVAAPRVCLVNHCLAEQLGLDLRNLTDDEAAQIFAGQRLPEGSFPIAQAYAGHQFGGFTMLGDGRAILLGEHRSPSDQLYDLQFKGSGRTAFSRGGDGRAALGPMLREYIISEAMAALGTPTTRSLAVVTTGEPVYRQTTRRGAILTRVAASHLRVGTFQYAAGLRNIDNLRALADYAIDRHYPHLSQSDDKYAEFLRAMLDRQAALVAQWQLIGFIHGVMNTDNVAISGETIDYGPCAFMNSYNRATVFSSIDHGGRYAYGNQPPITQWNLTRFAETLLPLISTDTETAIELATEILNSFPDVFHTYWLTGMRRKLGLREVDDDDAELVANLLNWMENTAADFTNTFRDLTNTTLTAAPYQDAAFQSWHRRWQARLQREGQSMASASTMMRSVNPTVIPRNHRVEEALAAAEDHDDLSVLHRLLEVLRSPYTENPQAEPYQSPPCHDGDYRTFCGT